MGCGTKLYVDSKNGDYQYVEEKEEFVVLRFKIGLGLLCWMLTLGVASRGIFKVMDWFIKTKIEYDEAKHQAAHPSTPSGSWVMSFIRGSSRGGMLFMSVMFCFIVLRFTASAEAEDVAVSGQNVTVSV